MLNSADGVRVAVMGKVVKRHGEPVFDRSWNSDTPLFGGTAQLPRTRGVAARTSIQNDGADEAEELVGVQHSDANAEVMNDVVADIAHFTCAGLVFGAGVTAASLGNGHEDVDGHRGLGLAMAGLFGMVLPIALPKALQASRGALTIVQHVLAASVSAIVATLVCDAPTINKDGKPDESLKGLAQLSLAVVAGTLAKLDIKSWNLLNIGFDPSPHSMAERINSGIGQVIFKIVLAVATAAAGFFVTRGTENAEGAPFHTFAPTSAAPGSLSPVELKGNTNAIQIPLFLCMAFMTFCNMSESHLIGGMAKSFKSLIGWTFQLCFQNKKVPSIVSIVIAAGLSVLSAAIAVGFMARNADLIDGFDKVPNKNHDIAIAGLVALGAVFASMIPPLNQSTPIPVATEVVPAAGGYGALDGANQQV